jgi:predicted Zn-dependent protease
MHLSARTAKWLALTGVLLTLTLVGWLIRDQWLAWQHLEQAREALQRGEPALARSLLQRCVQTWPNSGETRFLAARAARRCGELNEASTHLEIAAANGWVDTAIFLERALLQVQNGDLASAESYLQACLTHEHPDSELILEILTPAYLRQMRLPQMRDCVERWLRLNPQSATAWYLQGVLFERLILRREAVEAYSKAVQLEPNRRSYQLSLARALIENNRPDDARTYLKSLLAADPDNQELQLQLARSAMQAGDFSEASSLLEGLLQRNPSAGVLQLRGRLELEQGNYKQANEYLQRAAQLEPYDTVTLYNWLRCLRKVGTPQQIAEVEKRFQQAEADLLRTRDLTREMLVRPEDPHLRMQVGEIYLRIGKEQEGLRWLLSALAVANDHAPTHQLLAQYYQQKGQFAAAENHRRAAARSASVDAIRRDSPQKTKN